MQQALIILSLVPLLWHKSLVRLPKKTKETLILAFPLQNIFVFDYIYIISKILANIKLLWTSIWTNPDNFWYNYSCKKDGLSHILINIKREKVSPSIFLTDTILCFWAEREFRVHHQAGRLPALVQKTHRFDVSFFCIILLHISCKYLVYVRLSKPE